MSLEAEGKDQVGVPIEVHQTTLMGLSASIQGKLHSFLGQLTRGKEVMLLGIRCDNLFFEIEIECAAFVCFTEFDLNMPIMENV